MLATVAVYVIWFRVLSIIFVYVNPEYVELMSNIDKVIVLIVDAIIL